MFECYYVKAKLVSIDTETQTIFMGKSNSFVSRKEKEKKQGALNSLWPSVILMKSIQCWWHFLSSFWMGHNAKVEGGTSIFTQNCVPKTLYKSWVHRKGFTIIFFFYFYLLLILAFCPFCLFPAFFIFYFFPDIFMIVFLTCLTFLFLFFNLAFKYFDFCFIFLYPFLLPIALFFIFLLLLTIFFFFYFYYSYI